MPVRPENRGRYPADWPAVSLRIRGERAGWRCECRGECGRPAGHLAGDGRCRNEHGRPAWSTGSLVVLTTAHRDHTPENCDDANLFAACQGCHLHYDRAHHAETARATAAAARVAAFVRGTATAVRPARPLSAPLAADRARPQGVGNPAPPSGPSEGAESVRPVPAQRLPEGRLDEELAKVDDLRDPPVPVTAWLVLDGRAWDGLLYGWAANPHGVDDGLRGLVLLEREYAPGFRAEGLHWVPAEKIRQR